MYWDTMSWISSVETFVITLGFVFARSTVAVREQRKSVKDLCWKELTAPAVLY